MKKYLNLVLIIILGLFINGSIPERKFKNDLEEMNLKGNVKSICDTIYFLDSNANRNSYRYFGYNGEYNKKCYFFNLKGDTKEEYGFKFVYTNDDVNHPITDTAYYIQHLYDDKGNKINEKTYYNNGKYWRMRGSEETYRYDNSGKIIEKIEGYQNGDSYFKRKYSYKGNNIVELNYDVKENDSTKTIYKYNKKGNLISECFYNDKDLISYKHIRKFNDKNEITESKQSSDGKGYCKWTYKYDEEGNCIERISFRSDKKFTSGWAYKYDGFDGHGNWTRRIEYIKSNYKDMYGIITVRKIEYYK